MDDAPSRFVVSSRKVSEDGEERLLSHLPLESASRPHLSRLYRRTEFWENNLFQPVDGEEPSPAILRFPKPRRANWTTGPRLPCDSSQLLIIAPDVPSKHSATLFLMCCHLTSYMITIDSVCIGIGMPVEL